MKKATRRTKAGSSSKRASAKSKVKKTTKAKGSAKSTKAKRSAKSKKRLIPAGAKLKRVAKQAAVAAGLAAVGTALTELAPEQKGSETSTETEPKQGSTSTR